MNTTIHHGGSFIYCMLWQGYITGRQLNDSLLLYCTLQFRSQHGDYTPPSKVHCYCCVSCAVVAAKWTLKRLIRCAFELVQQQAGVWTRDLYWCCHYAGQYMPQLQQQLDQALELYVLLQRQQTTWRQQHRKSHQKPEQQQQREELQQDVAVAWEAIDSLLPHIETRFLKQMLTEEPGWLTKHIAGPIPASTYTAQQSRPTQKAAAVGAGSLQQQHQWRWSAVQESLQRLAAASGLVTPAAATHAAVEPAELLGARPPAVQIPIWGSVASYDWSVGAARTAACRHIQSVLLSKQQCSSPAVQAVHTAGFIQKGQGHRSELRSLPSSSYNGAQHADKCQQTRQDELFSCHPQPVVLRGLASGWPAVSGPEPWGLAWLSRQGFTSRVRAAPSLQFPFVEPQLVQLLQQIAGRCRCEVSGARDRQRETGAYWPVAHRLGHAQTACVCFSPLTIRDMNCMYVCAPDIQYCGCCRSCCCPQP